MKIKFFANRDVDTADDMAINKPNNKNHNAQAENALTGSC